MTLTINSDQDKTDDDMDNSLQNSNRNSLDKSLSQGQNILTNNKFQALENQRAKKSKMNEAAEKFKQKPKLGIKFLTQH